MNKPASLRSRREFQRVLRQGRRLRTGCGTFATVTDQASVMPPRLGLAVPSSIGGAVERNRIKRRLRAAFVACAPPPGTDVVVRADARASSVAFQELENTFRRAVTS